jgi:hypothetical protein
VIWEELLQLALERGEDIIRVPMNSSAIESLEYQPEVAQLTVVFTDGYEADYDGIEQWRFMEFVNAPSPGSFFNANVRGKW